MLLKNALEVEEKGNANNAEHQCCGRVIQQQKKNIKHFFLFVNASNLEEEEQLR